MEKVGSSFLDLSARFLEDDFLPRIEASVGRLAPEDLWWRPNATSNSVGNLLLHLAGNLRQWVVHGVGGATDVRVRSEEFSAATGPSAEELLDALRAIVVEAADTLRSTGARRLEERRVIQGIDVSVLEAVYHAVEHFSMHTGQILYITKLRTGEDLGFYRIRGRVAERRW